jgi:hypothetical protein
MNKKTGILLSIMCFAIGMVFGFMISPAKQGFGNNCGNTYHYYKGDEEEETTAE